ncbi:MAG: hypothetical protein ACXVX0_19190 [Blastococcus sp.]
MSADAPGSSRYRTLRVAGTDTGVLGVVIDVPPMNLLALDLGDRVGAL